MQKIAIDARESGTSTGRYIDKLVEHLYALQPAYEIVILTKPHRLEYMASIAPGFTIVESNFKEFTLDEQTGFKQQLTELKADLVHFGMVQQPVLYRGRHITTMHDLTTLRFRNPDKNPIVFTLKQQVYKWVNRRAARRSVFVITPTEWVRQDVARFCHIKPDKIIVTNEAADPLPTPSQPVNELLGKRFIMYVGRPTPHKNLERLIDAFAIARQSQPDLHLALAGKKDANYQRIADKYAKVEGLVFTDFISDQQLRWMYENCLAYVWPSLSEGFGLSPVEAMLHGAPVASSNASCMPEVLGDGAVYFDPKDTKAIAEVITRLAIDPIMRETAIENGRQQAAKYSWRRMAEQTLEVYRRALEKS